MEITKQFCKKEVVWEILYRFIFAIIMSVIATIWFCIKVEDPTWVTITLISVFLILFFGFIYLISKKAAIFKNDFYIVNDVLIRVSEIKQRSNEGMTTCRYRIWFSKNGEHEITIYNKSGLGAPIGDCGVARYSEPGDKIYLVMSNENKILQCYNAKNYHISNEEFELKDGKYHLRKNR